MLRSHFGLVVLAIAVLICVGLVLAAGGLGGSTGPGAKLSSWVGRPVVVYLDAGGRAEQSGAGGNTLISTTGPQRYPLFATGILREVRDDALLVSGSSDDPVWIARNRVVAVETLREHPLAR